MINDNQEILSIIVPCYNASRYVEKNLPFFIHPDLIGKIKVLLVDDGSTDDTKEKLQKFCDSNPLLFSYHHKENGGHGSVINYALYHLIKTRYFKVVDADDYVVTDELIKLVNELSNSDADVVINDYTDVFISGEKVVHICGKSQPSSLKDYCFVLHSITYQTSLFKEHNIKLEEKCYYEDMQYDFFPLQYVTKVQYLPFSIYCYVRGDINQSTSTVSKIKHLLEAIKIADSLYVYYQELKQKVIKEIVLPHLTFMLIDNLAHHLISSYSLEEKKNFYQRTMKIIDSNKEIKQFAKKHESKYLFFKLFGRHFLTLKSWIIKKRYLG